MYNKRMILEHIIALCLCVYTLHNLFSVEIFSGIQSIIMIVTVIYSVYVYSVYWDITKN